MERRFKRKFNHQNDSGTAKIDLFGFSFKSPILISLSIAALYFVEIYHSVLNIEFYSLPIDFILFLSLFLNGIIAISYIFLGASGKLIQPKTKTKIARLLFVLALLLNIAGLFLFISNVEQDGTSDLEGYEIMMYVISVFEIFPQLALISLFDRNERVERNMERETDLSIDY